MAESSVLSVTQLNEYLRMQMDGDRLLSDLFVRGEVSNLKYHSSGHIYFTLKDEAGQLKAVMFRSYVGRLPFRIEDGMRVVAHGRVSVYGASGQYQLYADEMQPDGLGSLALRFEQLKKKLESEGLFDPSKKKPLPPYPERIGVITSPTGAAIHDVINILSRRYPLCRVILFPALVQGNDAPASLIAGLDFFRQTGLADVIILGRGGGSMEDLWGFNDENLARAVFDCPIPVISAVGHESDFTICDFVADMRAPTPSAAAELAVPDAKELSEGLAGISNRLVKSMLARLTYEKKSIAGFSNAGVFKRPELLLDPYRMKLADLETRLTRGYSDRVNNGRLKVASLCGKMEALNPLSVLSRGYAAVSKEGNTVMRAQSVMVGDLLEVNFADGSVLAKVTEKKGV